jgi:hypothetical protein
MKATFLDVPREFDAYGIKIKDYGKLLLETNEMISLTTKDGKEIDITSKEWGYYLAPSLNRRLKLEGFKVALVINEQNKLFINAVEIDKIDVFRKFVKEGQTSKIICWLDEFYAEENKE